MSPYDPAQKEKDCARDEDDRGNDSEYNADDNHKHILRQDLVVIEPARIVDCPHSQPGTPLGSQSRIGKQEQQQ